MDNLPFSVKCERVLFIYLSFFRNYFLFLLIRHDRRPLNPLLKVVTHDRQWCSLPVGIVRVLKREIRDPPSLYELSLRKFYVKWWGSCMVNYLPRMVFEYVRNGPIGHCNSLYCVTPLFRECYFSVLQRQHERTKFTYSAIFCSKECTEMWLWQNSSIYKDIEWTLEDGEGDEDEDEGN